MLAKKSGKNFSQKAIAFLLVVQTVLIGIQSKNRLEEGDSTIEVLIWMINQYIPVLKQASRLEDKDKNDKQNKCAGDIKN
ncbi:hypothetical protein HW132_33640 [Brasilonema sp. CT11]|nr:hypothetical protein [Brasilonema sp. CT11]